MIQMLIKNIYLFIVLKCVEAVGETNAVIFASSYFKSRNVKFGCLIECQKYDVQWFYSFAKLASNNYKIATTVTFLNEKEKNINLKQCMNRKFIPVGVLMKSKCFDNPTFAEIVSDEVYFDDNHKWLIINENDNNIKNDNDAIIENGNGTNRIINFFDNVNLSVDADIIVATKEDNDYVLHEVFNFGKIQGGTLIVNDIGSWDLKRGFQGDINNYKYYRRWSYKNLKLRMVVVMSGKPKYSEIENMLTRRTSTPGVAMVTKTSATLLHELANVHSIKFNYTVYDQWIRNFNKNSPRVIASAIYFKEQDITPLLRIHSIRSFVGVIHPPLTSIETRYFYRIPNYGVGKFENQFLRPLTNEAWGCVVATMLICCIVLLLAAKIEERQTSMQYAFFSTVASFCQQFFVDENLPIRISTARKIAVLVTGLSSVLIYNYYTSSVVSWLLNGPPPSINSLEELIESPLHLILEDVGYSRSWIQTSTYYFNKRYAAGEDKLRAIKIKGKGIDAILKPKEIGIDMVKSGGFAFHTAVGDAYALISRKFNKEELCELGSLPSIEKTQLYACVQKSSPYTEFWTWSLSRMRERGIISCIQRRTNAPPIGCDGSTPRALALGGALPAFIVLAGGFLCAVVIVIFERIKIKKERPIMECN